MKEKLYDHMVIGRYRLKDTSKDNNLPKILKVYKMEYSNSVLITSDDDSIKFDKLKLEKNYNFEIRLNIKTNNCGVMVFDGNIVKARIKGYEKTFMGKIINTTNTDIIEDIDGINRISVIYDTVILKVLDHNNKFTHKKISIDLVDIISIVTPEEMEVNVTNVGSIYY